MELNRHFGRDGRGVSPVIGVILMVAITVVLAGVIGAFVMNMEPADGTVPNTNWEFTNNTDHIELGHTGGDAAPVEEFSLQVEYVSGTATDETFDLTDSSAHGPGGEMTAGDAFVMQESGGSISGAVTLNGDVSDIETITLVWESTDGERTQEVRTYEP